MTISIRLPDAWDAFNDEVGKQVDTRHEQCWDLFGEPLNRLVREVVPAYYEKLELGDKNIAMSKRGEVLDLFWGRIEQDAAALVGLGMALENLSATVDANVKEVAKQWSGDSFTAFQTAMGKVRTTLDAYADGARKVGGILLEAMTQARAMYADFAQASQRMLAFENLARPGDWHKMDERTGEYFESVCPTGPMLCQKNNEEASPKLRGQFATSRRMKITESDPCEVDLARVHVMYDNLVKDGKEEREKVRQTVRDWCDATDDFKDQIKQLLEIAVGNVYELSRSQAFSGLRLVGGAAGGGQPVEGGGYPGAGGGHPVDGGGVVEPIVEPTVSPEPSPEPTGQEAEAAEVTRPAPAEPETTETEPGTVTINDGARTIGVREADDGHVMVTVADGTGGTRTYDLDFAAASGLPTAAGERQEGVEQVRSGTNGKCVIQNGDLTITAERPLFAPDEITLTVDDGTGKPTTYTVDFPDVPPASTDGATDEPGTQPPAPGADTPTTGTSAGPADPASARTGAVAAAAPAGGQGSVPVQTDHLTSPQSWVGDARGSVSGVLVPEQSDGEAGLASAPDDPRPEHEAGGMVGAGLPMVGAPGAGGGDSGGRAGSGWSVHGDLFDSAEPVYSMHGVLGNDERDDRP